MNFSSRPIFYVFSSLILLFITSRLHAEVRVFTSNIGTTLRAELVNISGDLVTLKKEDEQTVTLKAGQFCPGDITFFKSHGLKVFPAPPKITTPLQLLNYLDQSIWNISATHDGLPTATAGFSAAEHQFKFFTESSEITKSLAIIDAKTARVNGKNHTITFNEDYTTFDLSDWPDSGSTRYGTLKTLSATPTVAESTNQKNDTGRPKPISPAEMPLLAKPSRFSGSSWTGPEIKIDLYSTGSFHEKWQNQTYYGTWKIVSESEIVVARSDGKTWRFIMSEDGKTMTRHDKHKFERNK